MVESKVQGNSANSARTEEVVKTSLMNAREQYIGKGLTAGTLIVFSILGAVSCTPSNPTPHLIGPTNLASNLFTLAEGESYPIDQKTEKYFQSVGIPTEPHFVYMRENNQVAIYDSPNTDNGFSAEELRIMAGILDAMPLPVIEQLRAIGLRPTDKVEVTLAETITDYRGVVLLAAEPGSSATNKNERISGFPSPNAQHKQKMLYDVLAKSQLTPQEFPEVFTHEIGHIFQWALMWYMDKDGVAKAERFASINSQYLDDPLSYLDQFDLKFNDNLARPYGMNNPPYEDFATIFSAFFTDPQGLWNTAVRRANNGHPGLREKVLFMDDLFPEQANRIQR